MKNKKAENAITAVLAAAVLLTGGMLGTEISYEVMHVGKAASHVEAR